MDNDLIRKEYIKKIEAIKNNNKQYYERDKPIITDQEYDNLKEEIINLEIKYSFLKSKSSPSKTVGFKPSKNFKKKKHKIPMLSLSNAFNEKDLISFEKKILNFLSLKNLNNVEYSAEPK